MLVPITIKLRDTPEEIGDAVNALAVIGMGQMERAIARGHPLPALYGGSIRYVRERPNREHWKTAELVAASGRGDCEDLCAYYVAQARIRNIACVAFATFEGPGLMHIRVRLPDGTIEDPSARLGMKGRA